MRKIRRTASWILLMTAMTGTAFADAGITITSFHGNGQLTWDGSNLTAYAVQWAPSATGPWTSTWEHLSWIAGSGSTYTAAVPMFYRVIGFQDPQSTLLIHGDGQDGSINIVDQNAHAVTVYGDTHITTNQSVFGGSSIYFDGAAATTLHFHRARTGPSAQATSRLTSGFACRQTLIPSISSAVNRPTSHLIGW